VGDEIVLHPKLIRSLGRPMRLSDDLSCAIDRRGNVVCTMEVQADRHDTARVEQRLGDAMDVAVGQSTVWHNSACALRRSGKVACWGTFYGKMNRAGQEWSQKPVELPFDDVATIAASPQGVTCAARRGGIITCWGERSGNAEKRSSDGIKWLEDVAHIDAVALSLSHTDLWSTNGCALERSSHVWCFNLDSNHPQQGGARVAGVSDAIGIGASYLLDKYACALLRDGRVLCWGENRYGQLGDGTTNDRVLPGAVSGLTDAISLSVADDHACAETRAGKVMCWGSNSDGQIGDGTGRFIKSASTVPGIHDAVEVACGDPITCVRHRDGHISCWGGAQDQTRDRSRLSPSPVIGITDAVAISAGYKYACAVMKDGKIRCFQSGAFGANADPATISDESFANVKRFFAGVGVSCGIRPDSSLVCSGDNRADQIGVGPKTFSHDAREVWFAKGAVEIAHGLQCTCALMANGTIECWGYNFRGELGDGTTMPRDRPVRVRGITDAVAISGTCALRKNGDVACWPPVPPLGVAGLHNAIAISAIGSLGCAVRKDGRVLCWELEARTRERGAPWSARGIPGISDAKTVSVGGDGHVEHACALRATGEVACWGNSEEGQLGLGLTVIKPSPTEVRGL
jgi:alpha-tubulin suppressor-like RCC1 family protein